MSGDAPPNILPHLTFQEFAVAAERDEDERHRRRQWGPWRLDSAKLELLLETDSGGCIYPVDLERFGKSAPWPT